MKKKNRIILKLLYTLIGGACGNYVNLTGQRRFRFKLGRSGQRGKLSGHQGGKMFMRKNRLGAKLG